MSKFNVQLTRTDLTKSEADKEVDDSKEYVVDAKNMTDAGEVAAKQAVADGFLKSASEGWRASTTVADPTS